MLQNLAIQLRASASESGPSGDHPVEHGSEGEYVAASVGRRSPYLFRRAVRRIPRVRLLRRLEHAGAVVREHHSAGRQRAMDLSAVVRLRQDGPDLDGIA